MLSKIVSCVIRGIDAVPVVIETDIGRGMPSLNITGLADASVREAALRVRSAILNSGFEFPSGRITMNIAPADMRKRGSGLDLAMAMGVLTASGQVDSASSGGNMFYGELSLDGSIVDTNGILNVSEISVKTDTGLVIPFLNRDEASVIPGSRVYAYSDLGTLVKDLKGGVLERYMNDGVIEDEEQKLAGIDFADVKGQEYAKRAIVIAASGGHDMFMTGSPGTGKSMLASRIPGIMPEMTYDEMIATTKVYSAAGRLNEGTSLIRKRPFRSPHHKISVAGLIGGGNTPMPGEITLSNNGVLFLDEFAEFESGVIDSLREPLENKKVRLIRKGETYTFPSDFLLIAAANPCKCGYYGDPDHECTCSDTEISRYRSKISGPILDRIDIHLTLHNVSYENLEDSSVLDTASMREMVVKARERQRRRFSGTPVKLNSEMTDRMISELIDMDDEGRNFIKQAFVKLKLNPRTFMKTLKVARTISDIDGKKMVDTESLGEALGYSRFGK